MSAVGSSYTLIGTWDTRLKLKVKGERSSSSGVLLLLLLLLMLLLVLAVGASQASGRLFQLRGGRKGYGVEMGEDEGSD